MWKRIILLTCLFVFFSYNFVLCFYFCNRLKPTFAKNIETIKSEIIFDSSLTCCKKILQIYNKTILQNGTTGKSSTKLNSSITNIHSNDSISTTEGSDQNIQLLQIYNKTVLQNDTIGNFSRKLNSSNTNIRSNDSISTTYGSDQFLEVTYHKKHIYSFMLHYKLHRIYIIVLLRFQYFNLE